MNTLTTSSSSFDRLGPDRPGLLGPDRSGLGPDRSGPLDKSAGQKGRIGSLHKTLFEYIKNRNQEFELLRRRKRNKELWSLFRYRDLNVLYGKVSREYNAVQFLEQKMEPLIRTDKIQLSDGHSYRMETHRYMSQEPGSWGICFAECLKYFILDSDVQICRPYWTFYRARDTPFVPQNNLNDIQTWNSLCQEDTGPVHWYKFMARLFVGPYREKSSQLMLHKLKCHRAGVSAEVSGEPTPIYQSLNNGPEVFSESTASETIPSLPWIRIMELSGVPDPLPTAYITARTGSRTSRAEYFSSDLKKLGVTKRARKKLNSNNLPFYSWLLKIDLSKYCHSESCERLGPGWSVVKDHLTMREVGYYHRIKSLAGGNLIRSLWEDTDSDGDTGTGTGTDASGKNSLRLLETIKITIHSSTSGDENKVIVGYIWDTYSENIVTRIIGYICDGFEYICKSSVHQIQTEKDFDALTQIEENKENNFKLLIEIDSEKEEKQTGYKAVKMDDGNLALLKLEIPEEARRTTSPHAAGKIRSDKAIPRKIWEVVKVPHDDMCEAEDSKTIDIKLVLSPQTRVVSCVYEKKAGFEYIIDEMAATFYSGDISSICGEGIHWCPTPRLALEFHCWGQEIANIMIEEDKN